ncbi:MAG: GNAT family N-acetyltransferase [Actinobacteria bacterium]|nr:GNAT family N-acetyltransferase [Actinomycetota bacterium]MBA3739353.1 GNAT family N-acetyltransferase [Actinomycetota bacterium]
MIRRGNRQDVRFLRDMLRHAFYWRAGVGAEAASLWRYVSGWGRRGDAAVIALEGGFPVGAAWFRLFAREEPGFGFVDEQTPEVSIAVVPSRRGRGIGTELLDALIEVAREQGFEGLTLSVANDSPALGVFKKQGFEKVEQTDVAWTMRLSLS